MLPGAAEWKLKKTRARECGTGAQGWSQQTVGTERPIPEVRTLMEQPLKKHKCAMEPECYREALLIFRAAVLLDHPEDKLFEADQDLVLKESGRVEHQLL